MCSGVPPAPARVCRDRVQRTGARRPREVASGAFPEARRCDVRCLRGMSAVRGAFLRRRRATARWVIGYRETNPASRNAVRQVTVEARADTAVPQRAFRHVLAVPWFYRLGFAAAKGCPSRCSTASRMSWPWRHTYLSGPGRAALRQPRAAAPGGVRSSARTLARRIFTTMPGTSRLTAVFAGCRGKGSRRSPTWMVGRTSRRRSLWTAG